MSMSKISGSPGKKQSRGNREGQPGNSASLCNPQEGLDSHNHVGWRLRWFYLKVKESVNPQNGLFGDTQLALVRLKFFMDLLPNWILFGAVHSHCQDTNWDLSAFSILVSQLFTQKRKIILSVIFPTSLLLVYHFPICHFCNGKCLSACSFACLF